MQDIKDRYSKETRDLITNNINNIKSEEVHIKSFEIAIERSEKIIEEKRFQLKNRFHEIFFRKWHSSTPLGEFLRKQPVMPHEKHESYQSVLVTILVELIEGDYGKTTSGGVEQFCFWHTEAKPLWESIHVELAEVLKYFFGIAPFLEKNEEETYWEIGFYVMSKWEETKDGKIVEIKK